jgi:hypothetical protein
LFPAKNFFSLRIPYSDVPRGIDTNDGVERRIHNEARGLFAHAQHLLLPFSLADIGYEGHGHFFIVQLVMAQADLYGESAAVFMTRKQFAAKSHRPRLGCIEILALVFSMVLTQLRRYQQLYRLTAQFFFGIAEKPFRTGVHQADNTVFIGHQYA